MTTAVAEPLALARGESMLLFPELIFRLSIFISSL